MSGKALGAEEDIRGPEMLRREKRSMLRRTRAPAATPAPSCPRRLGGRIPGRADVTRGPAVPLARQVPSQRRAGLPRARVTPSRGPPGGSSATGPGWAPPGRRPGRDAVRPLCRSGCRCPLRRWGLCTSASRSALCVSRPVCAHADSARAAGAGPEGGPCVRAHRLRRGSWQWGRRRPVLAVTEAPGAHPAAPRSWQATGCHRPGRPVARTPGRGDEPLRRQAKAPRAGHSRRASTCCSWAPVGTPRLQQWWPSPDGPALPSGPAPPGLGRLPGTGEQAPCTPSLPPWAGAGVCGRGLPLRRRPGSRGQWSRIW